MSPRLQRILAIALIFAAFALGYALSGPEPAVIQDGIKP